MTVLVEEFSEVARLPEPFRALFARHERRSLFLAADWFELLSRAGFDPAARRMVLTARRPSGAPLAALPLAATGRTVTGLANYYSLLYAPLLADAPEALLVEALALIAAALRRRGAVVQLRPMAADDPAIELLDAGFRRAGFLTDRHDSAPMRYLECAGMDGAAFAALLPSRLRNTIRRNAGDGAFALFTAPGEVEEAVALYETVYAASWKEAEPFPHFIRGLADFCARRGALRLGCWFVEGTPAAVQLWIVHNREASIYKLAHDPRHDSRSVGSALTLRMFREVLDRDRPARIDFGLGNEPFKADWTPSLAERIGWLAFDPRAPAGLLGAARHRAGRLLGLSRARKGV